MSGMLTPHTSRTGRGNVRIPEADTPQNDRTHGSPHDETFTTRKLTLTETPISHTQIGRRDTHKRYKNIIITGDLNCNLLASAYESNHLRDTVSQLSLNIVESQSTYHTSSSSSWLDVFVVDNFDKVSSFRKSDAPFINGHDLIELTYSFIVPSYAKRTLIRRSYREFDKQGFIESLTSKLSSSFPQDFGHTSPDELDIEDFLSTITNDITTSLDSFAPIHTFCVTRPPAPWLTGDLVREIRHRNRLYKAARRSGNVLNFHIYRLFRNNLTVELRKAREQYHLGKLSTISDPSKIWRELTNLGLIESPLPSPLNFFSRDLLNAHYAFISNCYPPCSQSQFSDIILSTVPEEPHFCFSHISHDNLCSLMVSTSSASFASGHDQLPLFAIALALPHIGNLLTSFFNCCLDLGYFPSSWKQAIVRPLSKVKSPTSPSDTRPIANLCEFSKLFERIMHRQILDHINSHNILDDRQSGYRKGYSTQSALLRLSHDIRSGVDVGEVLILVLFDFSKAFDTVSHFLLLTKLRKLGFSDLALKLIFSYLSGRSQAVVDLEGVFSDWLSVTAGVPQGSVLGPLLFSLFINDIGAFLRFTEHLIFADDTQIYRKCLFSQLSIALQLVAHDVGVISEYATVNGLSLNFKKSKVLILGSRGYVEQLNLKDLPLISVNGTSIPYVDEARNLGVIMSSDLSWKSHVSHISRRVHFTLHKLKFHKNSLSFQLRVKLVSALVRPLLDYCSLVYNDVTDELNTKLQRLINCAIRFIFNLRRDEHITPYRHQLGWLSVRNRRLYFLGVEMYRISRDLSPSYILDIFAKADPSIKRSSRPRTSAASMVCDIEPSAESQTLPNVQNSVAGENVHQDLDALLEPGTSAASTVCDREIVIKIYSKNLMQSMDLALLQKVRHFQMFKTPLQLQREMLMM
ncbi:uncharacterized protein LOC112468571 [Temnothorax curvispinosus]|uniref:Uncharacterized protein LOC112468571 n=1 Tax=Temnothorax curvispinosus TaxID=300111 RepID=A0A6J1RF39_9HYME|nr:uncharacterized protein LOC112468571 [Temnothorax curvispinosus]